MHPFRNSLTFASCLLFLPLASHAIDKTVFAELSIASADISNGNYQNSGALDAAVGLRNRGIDYRLGTVYFSRFDLDGADNTYLESQSAYLGLGKTFSFEPLDVGIGGGAMFSETEATLLGRELGTQNTTSPFLDISLSKSVSSVATLKAEYKYIDDLAGANLHVFEFGIRFWF